MADSTTQPLKHLSTKTSKAVTSNKEHREIFDSHKKKNTDALQNSGLSDEEIDIKTSLDAGEHVVAYIEQKNSNLGSNSNLKYISFEFGDLKYSQVIASENINISDFETLVDASKITSNK